MFNKTKTNTKEIYKWGIGAGVIELAYIILVVLVMMGLDRFMRNENSGPLAMLLVLILLVLSAAISGIVVFGYPAYLALQKSYKEALLTLLTSLITIIIGFLLVLLVIFVR